MIKKFLIMVFVIVGIGSQLIAQDEEVSFTDEDLTKYATVMKWAEDEKAKMGKEVGVWVKENEALSGTMYKELKAADKKGTMDDVEATDEEKAAYADIKQRTEDSKTAFKETYTAKIKDDIGAGLYNKLRKALKADEELKARYDAIYAGLEEVVEETEETESGK